MTKKINFIKHQQIIQGIDQGKSAEKIAKELKVSASTVKNIRKQHRPSAIKPVGGRPEKLSATTKREVTRLITSGKLPTATSAAKHLQDEGIASVSAETVRRALKQAGLNAIKKKKKPKLTPRHKKLRLEFARQHQDWTEEDWKRVIWSDETKINRLGSDGLKWDGKNKGQPSKTIM
jgi:transposase